ncbi:MAG: hypothetical protein M0C28_06090 [Candidatus Moduliflexus flocculans]|nr:hypothetical protein [Candidatus Moduliflexus flocculans]
MRNRRPGPGATGLPCPKDYPRRCSLMPSQRSGHSRNPTGSSSRRGTRWRGSPWCRPGASWGTGGPWRMPGGFSALLLARHYTDGRLYRSSLRRQIERDDLPGRRGRDAALRRLSARGRPEPGRHHRGTRRPSPCRSGTEPEARRRGGLSRGTPTSGAYRPAVSIRRYPSSSSLARGGPGARGSRRIGQGRRLQSRLAAPGRFPGPGPGCIRRASCRSPALPKSCHGPALPPCTVQHPADVAVLCRYGRCERL